MATTATPPSVRIIEPDLMAVRCPKCGEMNFRYGNKPPIINVAFVVDERGPHLECANCSHQSSVAAATGGAQ